MVRLTDQAATELQALREANGAGPTHGIKVFPNGESAGITIAEPQDGDEVIRRAEEPLLIVDRQLTESLRDLVFDYTDVEVDGQTEPQFVLRRAA